MGERHVQLELARRRRADIKDLQTLRKPNMDKLAAANLGDIEKNPELLAIARASGAAAFANNCAPCHGAGGQGAKGYPNLNDDDWLWGGKLADIQTTLQHGIRWDADKATRQHDAGLRQGRHAEGRTKSPMSRSTCVRCPACRTKATPIRVKGKKLFADNCAACHAEDGKGNQELGAQPDRQDLAVRFRHGEHRQPSTSAAAA